MLEDKLRETDWEVTQETIEEQVARESYLQWLRDQEKRARSHSSVRHRPAAGHTHGAGRRAGHGALLGKTMTLFC